MPKAMIAAAANLLVLEALGLIFKFF